MRHVPALAPFRRSTAGVSAVEFAMVFPVLMILLLAGGQLVLYIDATRKVQQIATSVSEMVSQAAPSTSTATTATIAASDIHFIYDASMVIFPYALGDAKRRNMAWWQVIAVSFAGISFTQVGNNCAGTADQSACYVALVNWTSTGLSANYRPCILPQLPVADTAPYSRSTLPRSLYGPGSIIAVDVSFTFVPTFGSAFFSPITITRSAFLQPRYVSRIDLDPTNNDGVASSC